MNALLLGLALIFGSGGNAGSTRYLRNVSNLAYLPDHTITYTDFAGTKHRCQVAQYGIYFPKQAAFQVIGCEY